MDLQTVLNMSLTPKRLNHSQLHPTVRAAAIELIKRAYSKGIYVLIAQTVRTMEEQAKLYAQGRTVPGKIVTMAKPGYSYHNYGLAVDYCLLDSSGRDTWRVTPQWNQVGALAEQLGFEWGGRWKDFYDAPHLQMAFGLTIQDLLKGKRPPVSKPQEPAHDIPEPKLKLCSIIVKGKKLNEHGFIEPDGQSMVPIRAVAQAAGVADGEIKWNAEDKKASICCHVLDSTILVGNIGHAWSRELAEALHLKVEWDARNSTVVFK